jgi:hypothetical protein
MSRLEDALRARGFTPATVHDSAVVARDLGFPILRDHTFESTAWLIAEAIRIETVASLSADIILVDRPVPDALGYLMAALAVTGRTLGPGRLERLDAICAAWVGEYDLIFVTKLDPDIPIGPGRDYDDLFRSAAGEAIATLLARLAPDHIRLLAGQVDAALSIAIDTAEEWRVGTRA